MIMVINFIFSLINFCCVVTFHCVVLLTRPLISGILLSTAVNAEVTKPLILGTLPSISVNLEL